MRPRVRLGGVSTAVKRGANGVPSEDATREDEECADGDFGAELGGSDGFSGSMDVREDHRLVKTGLAIRAGYIPDQDHV